MISKSEISMAIAAIFSLAAIATLGRIGETVTKVLVDTKLPANSTFFAGFIHFATPADWVYIGLAAVLFVLGILLAIAVQRTKWVPSN